MIVARMQRYVPETGHDHELSADHQVAELVHAVGGELGVLA
jgi:hypothetical protein